MLKHSFSDFSYAVNTESAKKGYKEILVCYIYNGVEVLRKVYVPEGPGISYIFEARKIIDKEIKDGTLSSYSYRFIRRNKKRKIKPRKIVTAVSEGKSIASVSGLAGFMYTVKPSSRHNKKFVEVSYNYNGEKVIRTLKLRGKENDDFVAKAKDKIKEETESGFLEKYSEKYINDKKLLNSTPTRTPVVRSGFTGKTIAAVCLVALLVIAGTATGLYFAFRNQPAPEPEPQPEPSTDLNVYTLTEGCDFEGEETVNYDDTYTCNIIAQKAGDMPHLLTVSIGDQIIPPTSYSFTRVTDNNWKLDINVKITANVIITAYASPIGSDTFYVVHNEDSNITCSTTSGSVIHKNETFECLIQSTKPSNYVPQIISISMNNRILASSEYTFINGGLSISTPVDGDIVIVYGAIPNEHLGQVLYTYDSSNHTATVEKLDETTGPLDEIKKITIPAKVIKPGDDQPYEVTRIKEGAFKGCSKVSELTVPFIGGFKYDNDPDIPTVGDQRNSWWMFGYVFGYELFTGCSAVTWQDYYEDEIEDADHHLMFQMAIPDSMAYVTVTSKAQLKTGAFSQCANLRSIVLINDSANNGTINIPAYAFQNCARLENATYAVGDNDTITIGRRAFRNCSDLVTFDLSKVTSIKARGFYNCTGIRKIYIPTTTTEVGESAFTSIDSGIILCAASEQTIAASGGWNPNWVDEESAVLYSADSIQDYITSEWHFYLANDGAGQTKSAYITEFLGNPKSETIEIPASITADGVTYPVKHLGTYAFEDYIFTKEFKFLTDSTYTKHPLETIANYAFDNCTGLTTITGLDNSNLKSIGSYAFSGDAKLTINDTLTQGSETSTFPDTLERVNNYAFYNCSKLSSLNVPGLKEIHNSSFEGCSHMNESGDYDKEYGLTAIRLSNELSKLGVKSFANCRLLSDLSFSGDPTYGYDEIPDYCFAYTALPALHVPSAIRLIGQYAFAYSSIASITFDEGITGIGDGAFFGCSNLSSEVALPASLAAIGDSVFEECDDLPGLDMSACSSIKAIPYALCYNCVKMRSFDFPKDAENAHITETIGAYTFGGCLLLDSLDGITTNTQYLPSSIKYVDDRAFMDCMSIGRLDVNNVTGQLHFGVNVFAGWSSGESILFKSQVLYLYANCFDVVPGRLDLEGDTKWGWHITRDDFLTGYFYCADCGSSTLEIQRPAP